MKRIVSRRELVAGVGALATTAFSPPMSSARIDFGFAAVTWEGNDRRTRWLAHRSRLESGSRPSSCFKSGLVLTSATIPPRTAFAAASNALTSFPQRE